MHQHTSLRVLPLVVRTALALAVASSLAACAAPDEPYSQRADFLTYCPGPNTLQGIDVSIYQGSVDWGAVARSGRAFAITLVGDGLSEDPTFDGNYAGIRAAGMVRGSYQFFRPQRDPIAQANIVIRHVGTLAPGDLAPMLDVEATDGASPAQMNAAIHAWVTRIEQALGRRPLIYTGSYFWDDNVGTPDFASYPLVLPAYGPTCPRLPAPWDHWDIHQYSGSGSCPGIGGAVDLDVFNGTLADLNRLAGGATCPAHCEGSVIVGADCGRGDCGVFGATCTDDSRGVRCVYAACPAIGEADICLSDSQIAHCVDGLPQPPGDCSAYAAFCSTVGAPQARCVSAFCAPSPHDAPVAHDGCWIADGSLLHCDANGSPHVEACPAGQACSVVGGAHCGTPLCPATGESDICVDDHQLGHCFGGSVVSTGDCGAFGAYCSTAGGGAPRCVSVFCVPDARATPVAHDICLPDGRRAHCNAGGAVEGATECDTGTMCVDDTMGVHCGTPSATDGGTSDASTTSDAGASDSGTQRDAGANVSDSGRGACDGSDGGRCDANVGGGCACRAVPMQRDERRSIAWTGLTAMLALSALRRRRANRSRLSSRA